MRGQFDDDVGVPYLMTPAEVAEELGVELATVAKYRRLGRLRATEVSRNTFRYARPDVESYKLRSAGGDGTFSVPDAARLLRVRVETIRALLHRGELVGQKVDGRWVITAEALGDFRDRHTREV